MELRSERARLADRDGERDHDVRGSAAASAEVRLVEYGNFECPYTRRARPVVGRLRQEFGERLLFVFRNFPLAGIHPHAQAAAEAAGAAASQGRYWEMHDLLFDNQRHLEDEDLRRYAQRLGLDPGRFDWELVQHAHRVKEDVRSGVKGTPTFFANGLRHYGANETSRRCGPPWRKRRGELQFRAKPRAVRKESEPWSRR